MRIIQNLTWQSVASAQGPVCSITINYDQSAVTQIGLWGSYLQSVVYPTALVVDLTTSDYNATVNINGVSTLVSARTLQGFAIQKGVAYLTITGESDSSGNGPTGSIPLTFYARQSDAPANVQNFLALIAQALSTNPGNPSVDFNANHFLAWAGEHAYKFGAVNTPVDLGSDGHNMVVTVDGTAAPNTYGLIIGTNDDPPITAPVYASRFYIGQGGPSLASDTNGNPALVSKNAATAFASILQSDGVTLAPLEIGAPIDSNSAIRMADIAGVTGKWTNKYAGVGPGSIPIYGNWGNGIYWIQCDNTNGQLCNIIMFINNRLNAGTFTVAPTTTFAIGLGTVISGMLATATVNIDKFGS